MMPTLETLLRNRFANASRTTLRRMVAAGRVSIDQQRARRLDEPVASNAIVHVSDRAPRAREAHGSSAAQKSRSARGAPASREAPSRSPGIRPLEIIHEDEDVLVVNKPAGLLTSSGRRDKRPTALAIVRGYVATNSPRAQVGLIHRLDRDASGLIVFSKSHQAYESLKTQFYKHTVERGYEALVRGKPNPLQGRIESRLVEWADGSVHSTRRHAQGQRAITEYQVIRPGKATSLLCVKLQTGRKHQIRVHLCERGWPIVGDTVYGKAAAEEKLMLKAVRLAFDHPRSGKRMMFELPSIEKSGS